MNMFTRCVIIFTAMTNTIAYDIIIDYDYVDTSVLDDISLSKDIEDDLQRIDDPCCRERMEYELKEDKYFLSAMGYVRFVCAVNQIKVDLEYLHPQLSEIGDYKAFTKKLRSYPKSFSSIVRLFEDIERECPTSSADTAAWKMPNYYELMYASLIGCSDLYYARHLSLESKVKARNLRALVLKTNGLTESSDEILKNKTFKEFAVFYARIRHGSTSFYHLVEKRLQNRSAGYLPEVLYNLGFLQAWNFSSNDLKYLNALRADQDKSEISTKSYRFEVLESKEKEMNSKNR